MNHRHSLVTLGVAVGLATSGVVFGTLLASCADYHSDPSAGAGGSGAAPASGGTGGTSPGVGGAMGGGAGLEAMGGGAGLGATGGASGSGPAGNGGSAGSGSGSAGTPAGGGPTEASCDAVAACGGDVVGTWMVLDSCLKVSGELNLSGLGTDCKSAPVTGTLDVTGTFTTTADGKYDDETTTTGEEMIDLPPECLTLSATKTTCQRIGGPLSSVGFSKVTCVDNAATTGCTCTATVEQYGGLGSVSPTASMSGSYMVADNVLSISDGVHDVPYPYCVAGSALSVSPPVTTKTGTTTGTILLQKQ